jgi:hypothetical protein
LLHICFHYCLLHREHYFLLFPLSSKKRDADGSRQAVQTYSPQLNPHENIKEEKLGKQKSNDKNPFQSQSKKNSNAKSILPENINNAAVSVSTEPVTAPVSSETVPEENSSVQDFYSAMNTYTWGSDSFKIEITNAGKAVNSAYADFAPVISADGSTMFFTSRRPVTEKEIKQGKQSMEHVYSCSMNNKKINGATLLYLPMT